MKARVSFLLIILGCSAISGAKAQLASSLPTNVRAVNATDGIKDGGLGTGEMLFGIPMPPGELKGSEFLQDEWENSTVATRDGKSFTNLKSKYNIARNELYFQIPGDEIRSVPVSKISQVSWENSGHAFVNASGFRHDGGAVDGLLEVLVEGETPLYKKAYIIKVDPTYRKEFDMGNKDTKLVKKYIYFTAKGTTLTELNTKSSKKLIASLGAEGSRAQEFISNNKIKVSREAELMDLFIHLNK